MSDKTKNYVFYICSILLLGSAIGFVFEKVYSPYIYAIAGAGVAVVLLSSTYRGDNLRLKRLNIQQFIAAVLLPLSSYLMFSGNKEWYLFLLISAVLQLYLVFVKDYEQKKENGNNNESAE